MTGERDELRLFDPHILRRSLWPAVAKLNPVTLIHNPVMFAVEIISILATLSVVFDLVEGRSHAVAQAQIMIWLWITVLFGNFAEAVAEQRGRARAEGLKEMQKETATKRLLTEFGMDYAVIRSRDLQTGDVVLIEAGDIIPADGEVIEGIASVDESAITGESAPVIRESGSDRSGVTGGTKCVSDWLKVRVTIQSGGSFIDRMIAMVEGTKRQKTPSEIALTILLVGQTITYLVVVAALGPFSLYSGEAVSVTFLLALLVILIPTTIGALLSAIGIAGMDRLVKANIIAKSGRTVEACGDVDTLLLDKTGTITFGNRMANDMKPLPGVQMRDLAEAAYLASLSDDTPEGRSILELVKRTFGNMVEAPSVLRHIPFSAETRISGVDLHPEGEVRKGAEDSIRAYAKMGENYQLTRIIQDIARSGGTPLVVARNHRVLGVIHLKDVIKPHIRDRFMQLRRMDIRTVMITGDNPLTAAAIAAEAGVDDFLAESTPERKLGLIRKYQSEGRVVAMCGDGANDAPALAQADVGVAMNDGTQAAKEAANIVDLDSDPTKLIEVVRVGKQLLISRGSLTTFSIANDVAKYFAILPPLFATIYPGLAALNIMDLNNPQSAILSAVIFNALVIIFLIPLALKGVNYIPSSPDALLGRNLAVYGIGGLIAPFIGIKMIDLLISGLGMV
ncbi:MAG TPA: potassium-transporting ATPase subunit KdpB [Hyphomicrobiales bacterium]|nr:potassium-transporting ATPase subunit KdpB [Hyphomicrobiales bacterium]